MKDLTLSNAIRYLFPILVVYLYLYICDASLAKQAFDSLGNLGITILSLLFLGIIIYLIYRPLFYDSIIVRLQDICRRKSENYRTYLKKHYGIGTNEAALLWVQIRDTYFKYRYTQAMNITASGIHLIYLVGIIAIPFAIWRLAVSDFTLVWVFLGITVITLSAAFLVDKYYENVELGFLRSLSNKKLDSFVKKMHGNTLSISSKERGA